MVFLYRPHIVARVADQSARMCELDRMSNNYCRPEERWVATITAKFRRKRRCTGIGVNRPDLGGTVYTAFGVFVPLSRFTRLTYI